MWHAQTTELALDRGCLSAAVSQLAHALIGSALSWWANEWPVDWTPLNLLVFIALSEVFDTVAVELAPELQLNWYFLAVCQRSALRCLRDAWTVSARYLSVYVSVFWRKVTWKLDAVLNILLAKWVARTVSLVCNTETICALDRKFNWTLGNVTFVVWLDFSRDVVGITLQAPDLVAFNAV